MSESSLCLFSQSLSNICFVFKSYPKFYSPTPPLCPCSDSSFSIPFIGEGYFPPCSRGHMASSLFTCRASGSYNNVAWRRGDWGGGTFSGCSDAWGSPNWRPPIDFCQRLVSFFRQSFNLFCVYLL